MKGTLLVVLAILAFMVIEWQITGQQAHQKDLNCKLEHSAYDYYYCQGK